MCVSVYVCLCVYLPLHCLLDPLLDIGSRVIPAEALDNLTILTDEELLEVPGNVRASNRRPQGDGRRVEGTAGEDEGILVLASVPLAVALAGVEGDGLALFHPLEEGELLGTVDLTNEKLKKITRILKSQFPMVCTVQSYS